MSNLSRTGRPSGPIARYTLIQADMKTKLQSGTWPLGQPLPSSRQLAAQYHISPRMICCALKALSREGFVRLTPGHPPIATVSAPLAQIMNKSIALVLSGGVSRLTNGDNQICRALMTKLNGIFGTLLTLADNRWRREFPAGLCDLPLSGVLLHGPFTQTIVRQYEVLDVPVVLLDQPAEGLNIHSVALENHKATVDTVTRLVKLGHRRIAFARTVSNSIKGIDADSLERQSSFLLACKKHKLKTKDYKVFTGMGHNTGSTTLGNEILSAKTRFTAVLTTNSSLAKNIAVVAQAAGLRVPGDLSIATFSPTDPQESEDWSGPQADFSLMAAPAVDIILSKPQSIQHIRMETVWHEGKTIGPCW